MTQEEKLIFLELIVLFEEKVHMNMCLNSEMLPSLLWNKADVIGDTIKETSCNYIKKVQGDSKGKVNIFGGDCTDVFEKKVCMNMCLNSECLLR